MPPPNPDRVFREVGDGEDEAVLLGLSPVRDSPQTELPSHISGIVLAAAGTFLGGTIFLTLWALDVRPRGEASSIAPCYLVPGVFVGYGIGRMLRSWEDVLDSLPGALPFLFSGLAGAAASSVSLLAIPQAWHWIPATGLACGVLLAAAYRWFRKWLP